MELTLLEITVIMYHILNVRFELKYKAVTELVKHGFLPVHRQLNCVDCATAAGFMGLRQCGEEN